MIPFYSQMYMGIACMALLLKNRLGLARVLRPRAKLLEVALRVIGIWHLIRFLNDGTEPSAVLPLAGQAGQGVQYERKTIS